MESRMVLFVAQLKIRDSIYVESSSRNAVLFERSLVGLFGVPKPFKEACP